MNPTRALPNTGARTHPGPLSLPVYSSQLSLHLIPKITTILYFVFIIALLKKKLIPDPIKLFFFQLSMFLNFILAVYYVEKAMAPTPILLPGKSHGQRSLVGCSPWGREESDTTERLHFHFSLSCIGE